MVEKNISVDPGLEDDLGDAETSDMCGQTQGEASPVLGVELGRPLAVRAVGLLQSDVHVRMCLARGLQAHVLDHLPEVERDLFVDVPGGLGRWSLGSGVVPVRVGGAVAAVTPDDEEGDVCGRARQSE